MKQGPTIAQLEESMKQLQAQIEEAKRKQAEAKVESDEGKKKKLKVMTTVPVSLLTAPKRGLVTTQRAALYSATTKPSSKE